MYAITQIQQAAMLVSIVKLLLLFVRALPGPPHTSVAGVATDWEYLHAARLPPLDQLLRQRAPEKHFAAYTLSSDKVVG